MPDEVFISLYILMTYEKHRKLNLREPLKTDVFRGSLNIIRKIEFPRLSTKTGIYDILTAFFKSI